MGTGLSGPEGPWLPSGSSGPSEGWQGFAQDAGKAEVLSNTNLVVQSQWVSEFPAAWLAWCNEQ